MKKVLIVSTVSRQFYLFEQGNIEVLKTLGFEVHAAANYSDANDRLNDLDIIRHHIEIERSPFSLKNLIAYKQLKKIMQSEKFDAVHCHSPVGGVLARLVAKSIGISLVIYTAHGFHFYKGAPLINWLVYYPVEKFLSRHTDVLITINQEDYERARKFKSKKALFVPGIGVDSKKFSGSNVDREDKRQELGIPRDAIAILSVGELNTNKNQEVIIKALKKNNDPNLIYIICGQGDRTVYLEHLAISLGIIDKVKFLGFRNDLYEIYTAADIFAFPSYREGLSVALMEAMASGLPVVCSNIRGNKDLIEDGKGGYLVSPDDIDGFASAINVLVKSNSNRQKMSNYNSEIAKKYDVENIKRIMSEIYKELQEKKVIF